MNEVYNGVISFARVFDKCKYCIIDVNYQKSQDKYLDFTTTSLGISISTKPEDNEKVSNAGGGYYDHNANIIYISSNYNSNEFSLLRTLTHEYGHCLQNEDEYNISNCDVILLEYHNIWFNENPRNRDILSIYNRIDETTGFRLSYAQNKLTISNKRFKECKESFNWGFLSFFDEYKNIIKSGVYDKNIKMLKDIYDSVQIMKLEHSLWLDLYIALFINLTMESKSKRSNDI